ncbi:DNA-binding NtrC family response regulator [Rubricella aquisinus]|uniref:Nif-specific regulatory protein n=1 Tax=Rubricella aquisinus TaxID=2028108 RepID=A0A840WLN5_9RHOB|nr:sigma-54 dependent transcriptional regulator [Rubricella aquisinus]MBB5515053.1 DNA-binding NtrC family response regulator [Rubricella aquisinus]
MTLPVLLVEDTASMSMLYETLLTRAGFGVDAVATAEGARIRFAEGHHPIVVLDMMLPDGDGLEILRDIHAASPTTRVIVVTGNTSVDRAVAAMQAGAMDFLVKPFEADRLLSAVTTAQAALEAGATPPLAAEAPQSGALTGFIGASKEMKDVFERLTLIGRSTASVFITGESGTGKEVAAQAIHDVSPRASGPFVPLNCGAIPSDLLESEVFGHLKGSFTGAVSDKVGAAMAADGGTLFLDEICEMDLSLQTKLLRFLQTSTVQPVGAVRPRKVDVRIVCATNRDPAAEVRAGRFREDLYYRLYVVPVHMPPLRMRGDDANLIATEMLHRFAAEEGKSFTRLSPDVRTLFRTHPWPGNVRQLLNVMRNVVVLHEGGEVTFDMLPLEIRQTLPGRVTAQVDAAPAASVTTDPVEALVGQSLADVERKFVEATITACDGSIPRAAAMLGVSPSTIYRKREAWGSSPE